ncbi:MAG: asparagine synthase (glutamine-hydrolyzing) [Deltaproteobacteria bacterium]|nr:asparagine synthase (glutamine-hydrolyzing) [Deltaproteobacteria bacterium]
MCGIVGIVEPEGRVADRGVLAEMCRTMLHRGPDGSGLHAEGRVGLAMQRLAIIDLAGGAQPMSNAGCPRAGASAVWIVYNGEVYNHAELRRELEALGHRFRTRCDTEAILHAYEEWGEACVRRLKGMFGFAIWDGVRRRLFLARDRLGIKPIYYRWAGGRLVFASEIKAILEDPSIGRRVDAQAVYDYVGYEFVPGPRTMFAGIEKLQPGHTLTFEDGRISLRPYWDLAFERADVGWEEAKRRLLELLRVSVERRLMSDVPLGVFLSGGVDSSSVLAMMSLLRGQTGEPIRTFTIGYDDPSFSEIEYARAVSRRFGTRHTEVMIRPVTPEDIERGVWHLDEPMTDLSAIPLMLLCQRVREDVIVCLSGEGGDEVFVGYDRFRASRFSARYYERLPRGLRAIVRSLVARLPDQEQKRGAVNVVKRFVDGARLDPAGEHMRWQYFLSPELASGLFRDGFLSSVDPAPFRRVAEWADRCASKEQLDREVYVDLKMTMADSVLMKVDKMSMASSLEVRVPFLDHELVEFAASLPPEWRMRGFETKTILKEAMLAHLPREILYRKKQGYSLPIKNWLRTELRDYAREQIRASELVREVFEPAAVERVWQEHLARRHNHNHLLWAVLNLALWHRRFVGGGRAAAAA